MSKNGYELIRILDKTHNSRIYLARDKDDSKEVVIKISLTKSKLKRFQQEVEMALYMNDLKLNCIRLLDFFKFKKQRNSLDLIPMEIDFEKEWFKDNQYYYCQVYEKALIDLLQFIECILENKGPRILKKTIYNNSTDNMEDIDSLNKKNVQPSILNMNQKTQEQYTCQGGLTIKIDLVEEHQSRIMPWKIYLFNALSIIDIYHSLALENIFDMDVALENLLITSQGKIIKCDLGDLYCFERNIQKGYLPSGMFRPSNVSGKVWNIMSQRHKGQISPDEEMVEYHVEMFYSVGVILFSLLLDCILYDDPFDRIGTYIQKKGGTQSYFKKYPNGWDKNEEACQFVQLVITPMIEKTYQWTSMKQILDYFRLQSGYQSDNVHYINQLF